MCRPYTHHPGFFFSRGSYGPSLFVCYCFHSLPPTANVVKRIFNIFASSRWENNKGGREEKKKRFRHESADGHVCFEWRDLVEALVERRRPRELERVARGLHAAWWRRVRNGECFLSLRAAFRIPSAREWGGEGGGRSSSRDTLNSGQCGADMMMWSMGLPEGRRGVRVLAGLALRRYRKLQQARFTCALTVPPL